jgi:hypothetical protein
LTDNKTVVPHPPNSPDLAPCDVFLFPKLKMKLKGRRFHSEGNWSRVAGSPEHTRRKWLLGMLEKLAEPLRSLSSLRKWLLWRWFRPPKSKVSLSVFYVIIPENYDYTSYYVWINIAWLDISIDWIFQNREFFWKFLWQTEIFCDCWLKYCFTNYHNRIRHTDISWYQLVNKTLWCYSTFSNIIHPAIHLNHRRNRKNKTLRWRPPSVSRERK